MPKMTLGDVVKEILSDMSGDQVNDIQDTEESMQVARIVRGQYYEMVDLYDLPSTRGLFKLNATGVSTPTHMTLPDNITKVEQIEYDIREDVLTDPVQYAIIKYMPVEEFLRRASSLDGDAATVTTVTDPSGVSIKVRNDTMPTYYTSFDNETIVFNSYDSSVDNNLQQSKTRCYGQQDRTLALSDDAEIDLEPQLFSELINRARAACFVRLKQTRDPISERAARKLEVRLQRNKWRQNGKFDYPGYGR